MTNLITASFVTVVSAALTEVAWNKVKKKEKKCKVPSSLCPDKESKKINRI